MAVSPEYKVVVSLDGSIPLYPPGYEQVAKFHYKDPFGLDVQLPFVNPPVYVYKLNGSSHESLH